MSNNSGIYKTSGRKKLYSSILETVGDTPVIKLNKLAPSNVDMFVKVESFNPAGSCWAFSLKTAFFQPELDSLYPSWFLKSFSFFHLEKDLNPHTIKIIIGKTIIRKVHVLRITNE